MTNSQDDRVPSRATFHEQVATTRWGAYLSDRERAAILFAHHATGSAGNVLDIGADGGRWSLLLHSFGWTPCCIDVDPEVVALCAERLPEARCICLNKGYDRLPVDDDSMDLILCIEVPPVLYSDWFLHECRRVLRKGGMVVTVFWNRRSLRGRLASRRARRRGTYDYYPRRYDDWIKEVVAHGFSVVRAEGLSWAPFTRASNSFLVKPAVTIERLLGLRKLVSHAPWVVCVLRLDH